MKYTHVLLLSLIALSYTIQAPLSLEQPNGLRRNGQGATEEISSNQKYLSREQNLRILQDNPFNPTGSAMTTTPGVKPDDNVLTIEIINSITQQGNASTRPNVTTNTSNPLYTTNLNTTALNITLTGSTESLIGNRTWVETSPD